MAHLNAQSIRTVYPKRILNKKISDAIDDVMELILANREAKRLADLAMRASKVVANVIQSEVNPVL